MSKTMLSLSSPFSVCNRLNPLLFYTRRRTISHSSYSRRFRFNRFTTTPIRLLTVAAASENNGVFTSPEIAKSFDFAAEERIYNWWESQGYFKPNFDRGGDPFVISMPPPNVTGSLHMGHAMFVTLEDIMVRYNRMKGRPTLWLPGTDHAGIATQLVVERMLASEGIKRVEMSRDQFTSKVWQWKEKYGGTITNQIKRLGASCDWSREHFTLDEQLSESVVEAFVRLHEKGLIYQGSYMVNWSPTLQTAVSDLEVEYSEESGYLYHIRYRVAGGSRDDWLTVATTRPETLFGDVALAVNPQDDRYSKYIGQMAIVPLTFGRNVPIISDKHVDIEFGTGVLKISPGHDHNDYLLARKLGLPILNVMNKDGTLNEVAGLYSGLDRFEARNKLWAELEETGLAVKKEPHTLRVPRSQRGGEVIEPLVSKQWFVSMEPLAEKALQAVEKGELTIIPERFEKIYNHWLSNIKDWCISRQLWWGHRIPVWYIDGKDKEEDYIVARNANEALEKAQNKYGKDVEIYQDPDVLDTWFSSALWPFSTLGWPDLSAEDFKKFYPTTMLETGHDILFFWVARMVMMGIEFTGKVPFSYIYLHGLIRDSQGRKMSKTLGNVIDPLDTIKEFGTDALRFTVALGTAGQDLNLSTERLTSNKAFTNKLWNAGKFVLQNLPKENDISAWENILTYKFDTEDCVLNLPLPERWVVSKLHLLIESVSASYDKFFFGEVGREIYDFFWADFADWYIEASKGRLYNSGNGGNSAALMAQAVLLYTFENILKVLHPFMPFVTEELWQALPNRKHDLIVSPWPDTQLPRCTGSIKKFENLQTLVRAIRNTRAEYSVEPAKRISASVVASNEVIEYIAEEKEVLALLSRLDLQNLHFMNSSPGNADQSVHLVAGEGLEAYLPLADMVDISAEVERLSKRLVNQTLSLAEFTAKPVPSFTHQDPVDLPTGPRQRTAEELERDRTRGFGSYGGGRSNRGDDESSVSRWGSNRVPRTDSFGSDRRDRDSNREPSRADEIDNWAAAKKPSFGNGSDRKDRGERGGSFFDSQSRADESDSWVTNKTFAPSEGRRFGGGGAGADRERRVGFGTSGGADSDNWNNKKKVGEFSVASERTENVGGGRPRLVLQPRSAPPSNENQDVPTVAAVVAKPKGANPFGEARPREQVLAEKGQDWKKIDEQLESMKIKETTVVEGFGKRGFGSGNGRGEDRSERSWRKSTPTPSDDGRSESAEKVEDEHIEEN